MKNRVALLSRQMKTYGQVDMWAEKKVNRSLNGLPCFDDLFGMGLILWFRKDLFNNPFFIYHKGGAENTHIFPAE